MLRMMSSRTHGGFATSQAVVIGVVHRWIASFMPWFWTMSWMTPEWLRPVIASLKVVHGAFLVCLRHTGFHTLGTEPFFAGTRLTDLTD